MTEDHPLVRTSTICPACSGPKDEGLVVCWRDWSFYDMRNGNAAIERLIDAAEVALRNRV